jgi:hypothetical protein
MRSLTESIATLQNVVSHRRLSLVIASHPSLEMTFFWEQDFCLFLALLLVARFTLDLAIQLVSREKVTFTVKSVVDGLRLTEILPFMILGDLRERSPPLMFTTE